MVNPSADIQVLISSGVNFAQGYGLAQPRQAPALENVLANAQT